MEISARSFFVSLFLLSVAFAGLSRTKTPLYRQADADIDVRVEDLLGRMTLDEKIGQLNQRSYWYSQRGRELFFPMAAAGQVGSFMNVTDPATSDSLQYMAVECSRLGIPLLMARDVIHGYKTIFPIPLGLAATFSPEMAADAARIAAVEASSDGIRWTFAPMLDIARDPRWGRIAEGCGEDPYLASLMAEAMVRGFQHGDSLGSSTSLAACAKHFVAYGAAEGGRDYNCTNVTGRELRQTYFPPFEAALRAGALTFMSSFNANDGIPASCNRQLLHDVLRDQWGFKGFVVSDCFSVRELIAHGVAADEAEAAAKCISAGVDMDMEDGIYSSHLRTLVGKGLVSEEDIDRAVRGILRVKFKLGLFENPYVATPQSVKYAQSHLDAARRSALMSAILLKNDNKTLPLSPDRTKRILLTGPLADATYDQLGTWIFDGEKEHTVTLLQALRNQYSDSISIVYEPGLKYSRHDDDACIERAVAAADVDAIIVAVGEEAILSGEGHSMAGLGLVGGQSKLIERLKSTGKPLVMIVMAGRPLAIGREAEMADAVLYSFHPGTMGGPALADLLMGRESPSGKTPVTFPSTSGQCPIYYNHPSTGRPATGKEIGLDGIPEEAGNTFLGCTSYYLDAGYEPLYPFGYGLSYTDFDYSDLKLDSADYPLDGTVRASFTLTNKGNCRATEVAQLYTSDVVASVTPAVTALRRFERVTLAPGESRRMEMSFPVSELAFVGSDLEKRVEPGEFILRVGTDSRAPLSTRFTVR